MKNVQEYFCSYDQTEELLKLGMKFMPMCSYKIGDKESIFLNHLEADDEFYVATKEGYFPAPLKSQAFDFFRENHGLEIILRPDCFNHESKKLREYVIISYDKSWKLEAIAEPYHFIRKGCFKTPGEAKSSCINKLIELAKQRKPCQI